MHSDLKVDATSVMINYLPIHQKNLQGFLRIYLLTQRNTKPRVSVRTGKLYVFDEVWEKLNKITQSYWMTPQYKSKSEPFPKDLSIPNSCQNFG